MRLRAWISVTACAIATALLAGPDPAPAGRSARPIWLLYDSTVTSAAAVARAVTAAGGQVRYQATSIAAVSAELSGARARRIRGVIRVQPVGRMYLASPASAGPVVMVPAAAQQDSAAYGPNYGALRELGVPTVHNLQFTARNVRIALIDTGFEPSHEVFAGAVIIAQRDFINNDDDVRTQPGDPVVPRDQEVHGTWVWSVLAGNKPGQIIGPAYDAEFLLAKVDVEQLTDDFAADEDRWVQAVDWAITNGAQLINSSLAYRAFIDKTDYTNQDMNGDIALSTRRADRAAREGVLVVTAMGNVSSAPTTLMAPADGDSLIAVGAIDAGGNVLSSSARGPTADQRTKPELVARGSGVYAAAAGSVNGYQVQQGTSLATPFITGAAALFMQQWPQLNVMTIREALLRSGSNAGNPDNNRGWGVPDVGAAILFPLGLSTTVSDLNVGTNALTSVAPTFSWAAGNSLVHPTLRPVVWYHLRLATDNQMNNIVYEDSVQNAFALTVKRPLRPRPAIFWQIAAEAFGIRRTTPVMGSITMPAWVELLVLNDVRGEHINTTRPTFRWGTLVAPPPIGPLTYQLQVMTQTGQIVQTLSNLSTTTVTLTDPLTPNRSYRWRVIANSQVGVADTVESRGPFVVNSSSQPPTTSLYPSFPNPFPRSDINDGTTRFWFDLNAPANVELAIYDLRGRLVKRLIPAQASCGPRVAMQPGQYGRAGVAEDSECMVYSWDGTDQRGQYVPRGVYIARLTANGSASTQRVLYLGRD
ncbi:MAG TPA: S8 family serine peptidase [Longimicrobiales bacterium]|nr:S8 family serine peptidase [Longimicrobiales bacterium]